MKHKHPRSKPNQQILEEASGWFVDFRVGDIDAGAREAFHEWLRRSPDHVQAYMEVAGTYAELRPPRAGGRFDVEALIAHARSAPDAKVLILDPSSRGGHAQAEGTRPPSQRSSSTRWYALAASFLLVALSLGSWYFSERGTYQTSISEQRSIVLSDGSTVALDSHSRIRVRYDNRERHIDLLRGQALFEVARDATRPFVVQTEQARVRAIGTQFDVYSKPSGTIITVIEGRVAVQPPEGEAHVAELSAGEQVVVKPQSVERPARPNVAAAVAWTSRQLVFDATPLQEVAEEFNRHSARRLIISGPNLGDFHVSGTYSSTNPESLLRFLRAQPGLQLIETDDEIRVTAQ